MKIAVLIAGLPPDRIGGAEIQAARISTYLARDHDVCVLTRSSEAPPELVAQPRARMLRRSRIDVPVVRFVTDLIGTLIAIGARRREIDVIVSYQTVIDGLIAAMANMLFGIPVLHSVRSEKEYKLNTHFTSRIFTPFVFRNVDRIAVQSESLETELLKELELAKRHALVEIVRPKLCVLPNGIDLPAVDWTAGDYVLYVGRLVEPKGVVHLIEAMKQCPAESLIVVGDGGEMRRLKEMAVDMANVEFVGRVQPDDVEKFIRKAKLLVLPSLRDEGLPNVIMQAMAHGKPVIASKGAGVPDLVEDGETGYLTEPGDSSSLARWIRELCANEGHRRQMGERAMQAIRIYEWPNVLRRFNDELARFQSAER